MIGILAPLIAAVVLVVVCLPDDTASPAPALVRLPWSSRVSPAFVSRVREIAAELKTRPEWLMIVMAYESGYTFRADKRNKRSQAVGLIQFLPSTALELGTTDEQLAQMTPLQQLEYVRRYFLHHRMIGRLTSLEEVYTAVFGPAFVGRPSHTVLHKAGTTAYDENASLDKTKKGFITKGDLVAALDGLELHP